MREQLLRTKLQKRQLSVHERGQLLFRQKKNDCFCVREDEWCYARERKTATKLLKERKFATKLDKGHFKLKREQSVISHREDTAAVTEID